MIRLLRTALLSLPLLHGAALAQDHAPVPLTVPVVGDAWTYQYTDVWKGVKGNINQVLVTAVDQDGVNLDIRRAASGAVITRQRMTLEMNPVDRGKMHFAPAFVRYAFPLEPGKTWQAKASGENASAGKRWRYTIEGKVEGWDKIKVPAGEFDALKVVVVAYYQGEETGSRGGSGQLRETLWFAPEVNNFVKLDYHDTDWNGSTYNRDSWELTAYARKGVPAQAAR